MMLLSHHVHYSSLITVVIVLENMVKVEKKSTNIENHIN